MKTFVDVSGLDGVLRMLQQLPEEVVSKRGGPVKLALKKGATVIYKQADINLMLATQGLVSDDKQYSTGLLRKNLIVSRGKEPVGSKGERYLVRVRRKSYPDRKGEVTTTLKTAQILEYGSSKQQPDPWVRPAFESKAEEAIRVISDDLRERLDKIVKKLARQTT